MPERVEKKAGVVVFPGSNCDHDVHHALASIGWDASFLWHKDTSVGDVDVVVLPGGFSYGDYLRAGAIARFSPIMADVARFADAGGTVIGICNGFQILAEAGLLPGTLTTNANVKFVCKDVRVKVVSQHSPLTRGVAVGTVLTIPVAHAEGNYYADDDTLDRLEANGQVVFQYEGDNPNGAIRDIAGVSNEAGNVVGLMPHPERCADEMLGNTDGLVLLRSLGAAG